METAFRNCLVIDYDGVIADTNSQKSVWISQHLGLTVTPGSCNRTQFVQRIGLDNYERMASVIYGSDFSLSAKPLPGLRKALTTLSKSWRLIVFSARSTENLQWAIQWLEKKGLVHCFEDIVSSQAMEKLALAQRVLATAILDDDIRHLISDHYTNIKRYHFSIDLPSESIWEPPIMHIKSWRALCAIIENDS